jgi:NADPH-dependent curcumin reductase CurA
MTGKKVAVMQKQWRLAARPDGIPDRSHFELAQVPVPTLEKGKAVVKTLFLGVAPVMLRYMRNETEFESPMEIGEIMAGRGVAQVIESDCEGLPVGAIVQARVGWQEYALIDTSDRPAPFLLPTDLPLSHGIGAVSLSGITALVGVRDIGLVKPTDRILVSGAAGGVGSHVAQVAKALGGKHVVGIAGGPEKCDRLLQQMGFDEAIDYKNEVLDEALDKTFPEGIDLYFDNVGGPLLDSVLARLRRRARIVICGSISEYLVEIEDKHRFVNLQNLGRQDAKMEGFFVFDYEHIYPECLDTLSGWVRNGQLNPVEDISVGIETMPDALADLYLGNNVGVRMVQVGEPNPLP